MKTRMSLMEYVWLAVLVITLIFFGDAMFRFGWQRAKTFLLFAAISLLMYLWRRQLRKSEEAKQQDFD